MHKPCSYALLFITQGQDEPFHFAFERGPGVMQQFVESLQQKKRPRQYMSRNNKTDTSTKYKESQDLTLKIVGFADLH